MVLRRYYADLVSIVAYVRSSGGSYVDCITSLYRSRGPRTSAYLLVPRTRRYWPHPLLAHRRFGVAVVSYAGRLCGARNCASLGSGAWTAGRLRSRLPPFSFFDLQVAAAYRGSAVEAEMLAWAEIQLAILRQPHERKRDVYTLVHQQDVARVSLLEGQGYKRGEAWLYLERALDEVVPVVELARGFSVCHYSPYNAPRPSAKNWLSRKGCATVIPGPRHADAADQSLLAHTYRA